VCSAERRGLPKWHPKLAAANRLVVALDKGTEVFLLDQVDPGSKPAANMPPAWRGLCVYYRVLPHEATRVYYLDTPDGLLAMRMTPHEAWAVSGIYAQWSHFHNAEQVLLLRNKASGKELDPRFFNDAERRRFDEADAAEWSQWIANGVVRLLPPEEEAQVSRDQIFASPLRYVRTTKGGPEDPDWKAKSRLVIPGHLDPQLGEFRTDSPTTSALAIAMCTSIAASLGWPGQTFDVATAFLSGEKTDRQVYIRAPRDGLPAIEGMTAVTPLQVMEVVKGAYGLAEAPRLWYLRARKLLEQAGFKELAVSRAVFRLASQDGRLVGLCTLHVDDGLLYGNPKDPTFKSALAQVNRLFNIKEWHSLSADKGAKYLGAVWRQSADCHTIVMDMAEYISTIEWPEVLRARMPADQPLSPAELTAYRSLLMKLAWPVRHVLPQYAYSVSSLASQSTKATGEYARSFISFSLQLLLHQEKIGHT